MRLITTNFVTEDSTDYIASNINPLFPVANLRNNLRSKILRTNDGTTTLDLVFDFHTAEEIDSIVLLWTKENGIRLTGGATLKIQANPTNSWASPAVDQTLTIDNTYLVATHHFTSNQSYRFWRLLITDVGNPYEYIEIGKLFIGKSEDIEAAQNGFKFKILDGTKRIANDFGHRYYDRYPQKTVLEFSYKFLEYSAIQVLENAFRTNGNNKPVVVVIDESEAVFDKDHYMIYGNMGDVFGETHVRHTLLDQDGLIVEELS